MAERRQLAMLAGIAEKRCGAAGERLGRSVAALKESQSRLALLERYRDEYGKRLSVATLQGMAGDELRNFRDFLGKLDEAIAQQRADVEGQARGVGDKRAQWVEERKKEMSFDALSARAEVDERARDDRRQQKLFDEISARLTR